MASKSPDIADTFIAADRADCWERGKRRRQEASGAVTELMLDLADLQPGDRVLDVAAGTGDTSLLAARRVQPSGCVLAVDISANMLKKTKEAARNADLTNIETEVMNAERLILEADSFDAVICSSALMLFPQPVVAVAEMRRVVKPGGRVSVRVFSTPEKNPFQSMPLQVVRRIGNMPPPSPTEPGMFALSGAGMLEATFRQAGFQEVSIHVRTISRKFSSLDTALESIKEAAILLHDLMANLTDDEREQCWREIEQGLSQFEGPSGFDLPGEVILAVAIK